MARKKSMQKWTVEVSVDLYGIRNWSSGYFDISPKGEVVIRPFGRDGGPEVSVLEIIHELKARGYDLFSVVADPKFADPEHGDFTLAPDSPAFDIGFVPIDLSTVGPRQG